MYSMANGLKLVPNSFKVHPTDVVFVMQLKAWAHLTSLFYVHVLLSPLLAQLTKSQLFTAAAIFYSFSVYSTALVWSIQSCSPDLPYLLSPSSLYRHVFRCPVSFLPSFKYYRLQEVGWSGTLESLSSPPSTSATSVQCRYSRPLFKLTKSNYFFKISNYTWNQSIANWICLLIFRTRLLRKIENTFNSVQSWTTDLTDLVHNLLGCFIY